MSEIFLLSSFGFVDLFSFNFESRVCARVVVSKVSFRSCSPATTRTRPAERAGVGSEVAESRSECKTTRGGMRKSASSPRFWQFENETKLRRNGFAPARTRSALSDRLSPSQGRRRARATALRCVGGQRARALARRTLGRRRQEKSLEDEEREKNCDASRDERATEERELESERERGVFRKGFLASELLEASLSLSLRGASGTN